MQQRLHHMTSIISTTWPHHSYNISFHQLIFHIGQCLLTFVIHSATSNWFLHIPMDYIDAATSGTLSPHILPVMDLQKILLHISDTLPPMLHLPVSPDDTLYFYRYLCTHILIENKQFLLLIDVPIQDMS